MGKLKTHSRLLGALLAAAAPAVWGEIYLPPVFGEAKTPETRTLTAEEEIRAIDDPDFPGIATLTIRPRVKTAPVIARP